MKLLHPFTLSMGAAAIGTIGVLWENYPEVAPHAIWLSIYGAWLCGAVGGIVGLSRPNWRARWVRVCQKNLAKSKKNALVGPLIVAIFSLLPIAMMFTNADTDRLGMRYLFVGVVFGVHRSDWPDAIVKLSLYSALLAPIAGLFLMQASIYLRLLTKRPAKLS